MKFLSYMNAGSGPEVIKLFFMLNLADHDIYPAHYIPTNEMGCRQNGNKPNRKAMCVYCWSWNREEYFVLQ